MRKSVVVGMLVVWLSGLGYANCGNGNGNGNGCGDDGTSGPQGPAGPAGPQGSVGTTGAMGQAGVNGTNGKDGKDGRDMTMQHEHAAVIDAAIRLYDGKRVQLQVFDTYRIGAKPSQDLIGAGYNMMLGARVVFKLGTSYEEREIARLRKQLGLK